MIKYDHKIAFDRVAVGTESVQYYEIKNGAKNPNWTVIQKPGVEKNVNAFILKKKVTTCGDTTKHEIAVQYKPYQPCQRHINYYLIENLGENDIILKVEGYSEGLFVRTSVKHLNFYRFSNDIKTKSVFEIHNYSMCKIKYQFDIDNTQKIFNIEPKFGEILPERYCYINVQFVTEQHGLFFLDLPILINLHQPIYVELFGINSPKNSAKKLKQLRGQCSRKTLENGYEKYMTDKFGYINEKFICAIKPDYANFSTIGSVNATEILNFSDNCVEILWSTEDKNIEIDSHHFHIRPNDRYVFEETFRPKITDRFYGGQIYGRAFILGENNDRNDPETIIIPLSLRYAGNAFYRTKIWTPSTEFLQDTIMMPVCVKNRSVFSTFFVQRLGEYPVCFKVVPPGKKSNFEVKPMVGLMENDFQIFVVKFSAGKFSNCYCKEKWKIQLNYIEKIHLDVTFKVFVQEPNLIINENNEIDFGKVFPGCKKFITVTLCNNTQNIIKFSFPPNKWFIANPSEDVIECYSTTKQLWTYTADCDVPEESICKYEMRILEEKKVVSGLAYYGHIKIFAQCCFGKLCASPVSHDFGAIVCGKPVSTNFTLFNFSEVTLHFLLRVNHQFGDLDDNPVQMEPCTGSIKPQENINIQVTVQTYNTGLYAHGIQYFLRESEDSDFLVEFKGPTFPISETIFKIDYYSFYPTLKFMEIGRNSTGPLFGKMNVWDFFNMDNFNELLRTIKMNETKSYTVRLPDAEAGLDISKSMIIIIKNVSREDTELRFVREKICACDLKELSSQPGIGSFRKYAYDCPHRKLLTVEASDKIVKAYQSTGVFLEIKYLLFGPQELCYLMKFSHNRTIKIYFKLTGLRLGELSTYYNGFTLTMNNVYIGELHSDLQTYWFLNNTRLDSNFELDTKPLDEYNKKWGHNVLVCLNPCGVVPKKTVHSIEFLFAPVAPGKVHIELPFLFGTKHETMKITGIALPYFAPPLDHIYFTEIGREHVKLPDLLVNLSTEHVVLRNIPTHCQTTRILTMRNAALDKDIGFHVDCSYLDGIIRAQTIPSSGLIKPRERIVLILKVQSGGVAAALRVTLLIHLVDHTALHKYFKTTAEFQKQIDARNDAFCYDSSGQITYPQVPTVRVTQAPKVFHRIIAITCHIIDQIDMDVKMPIQDQLKHTPFATLSIYNPENIHKYLTLTKPRKSKQTCKIFPLNPAKDDSSTECHKKLTCAIFSDEEYVAVNTVLSCLLYDIIFSKKFMRLNQKFAKTSERYYTQFKTDLMTAEEEKEQVELVVNRIPKLLLAETLEVLLADSVIHYFKLGSYPFTSEAKEEPVPQGTSTSCGKIRYTEKFSFLLDNL